MSHHRGQILIRFLAFRAFNGLEQEYFLVFYVFGFIWKLRKRQINIRQHDVMKRI